MKILQINTVYPNGSTGKIAKGIHDLCSEQGIECVTAYRYAENAEIIKDTCTVSSYLDCHIHNRLASLTMLQGIFSYFKTRTFLKWVDNYNPDIIHLHNIHGSYINHRLLFNYIKSKNIKTVWTLHDCWALTGCCPYFDMIGCDRWRTECHHCPQKKKNQIDFSKTMHKLKKKWFSGVDNIHIVANSKWTAELAKQSYLDSYPIKTIYNGIDRTVFTPTTGDFAQRYNCAGKHIVLAVAFDWGKRKGLDVIAELSKLLDDNYQIVIVGTNEAVDKSLPDNIISIHRTDNQKQLAEIYSAADVFINPTREEAFGLVNVEALACGTPVITFNTGGSPEGIDESCGTVVEKNDIVSMKNEIVRICADKPYSHEKCVERAKQFDMRDKYFEYVELYKELTEK